MRHDRSDALLRRSDALQGPVRSAEVKYHSIRPGGPQTDDMVYQAPHHALLWRFRGCLRVAEVKTDLNP